MKAGCQIYVKNSLEAAELYIKAFDLTPSPEMTGFNEDGTYEHVSLMHGENEIIAIAENSNGEHGDTIVGKNLPHMAFNVSRLGTREAVDHAYAVLSAEARFNENPDGPACPFWDADGNEYWFSLVDKFGVYWGVGK